MCRAQGGRDQNGSDRACADAAANRRMIAAVLGVWALIIQAFLPVAGAMASPGGDDFWGALCSNAGVETSYSTFDGVADEDRSPVDHSSYGAGCGACITCACVSTNGCGCGSFSTVLLRRLNPPAKAAVRVENPEGTSFDSERTPRGPPYA
ncbi:MAG: hypothetical protein RLN89_08570 [Parvibaculum sp.]